MIHDGALDLDAIEAELRAKNVPMSQVQMRHCV